MTTPTFDAVPLVLGEIARDLADALEPAGEILAIRDLWGRIRFIVSERPAPDDPLTGALRLLAEAAVQRLGLRAYAAEDAILYADESFADIELLRAAPGIAIGSPGLVFRLIDRQITGQSWATVSERTDVRASFRIAMYSLKGGVGRSTATAVAAWNLARLGRSVLVLDLDMESPGLSASLLPPASQPEFGIVDWFMEDVVGQGDTVIAHMSARAPLAHDLPGEVWVVPSHGAQPGDFMAKLGRCHLDLPGNTGAEAWDHRLLRLVSALETDKAPDVVLLDARSGFHDLASAVVTELADIVLLFALDSEQTWSGYRLLFEHWQRYGVAERIRERLQIVAALIPETDRDAYLTAFRERAWGLFRDHLYDELGAGEVDGFSFDLNDSPAPHTPLPIYWHRGLASLGSLASLDPQLVAATAGGFLSGLDELLSGAGRTAP
ncbi:MAG: P-loop NTPase [Chromatiaceae bacterium]|nr:P-loop NTPase [Chromatiaceae bacterium]